MQAWAQEHPFRAETKIADDRLSWSLFLRVDHQPPLDTEWNFAFGEVIHNLRSSLNNMVYDIAVWTGVTDARALRRVQFPICATRIAWQGEKSRVECLPAEYVTAIEAIQPFQRGEAEEDLQGDLLLVLQKLDNQDKHHLQITPHIQPMGIEHDLSMEFETEEGAAASVPPYTEVFEVPFRDGELLMRSRTKGRIAGVHGGMNVAVQVQVVLVGGRQEGITHLLAALCFYTRQVMDHVAAGEPSSQAQST